MKIIASENQLVSVLFLFEKISEKDNPNSITDECTFQLKNYFEGKLQQFELPLSQNGTDFQKRVWKKLQEIPMGKTWSYGKLATELGDPKLIRAVGAANGANPISIIVPCHRVVGANGSLVGYAGGLQRKKWLLGFEANQIAEQTTLF